MKSNDSTNSIKIFNTVAEFKKFRKEISIISPNSVVGFAPTMGALHQGHAELLKQARQSCDIVILSLFVNPTQFNDPNDFKNYPITLESDIELAQKLNIDAIIIPNYEEIYKDNYAYKVTESQFSTFLCGASRPGHFDGVLTVVMKLFNIVSPHKVFFGEKDYQQLQLIKKMIATFFMDIELIPVPTVRHDDGLAMSSRNTRLTSEERQIAPMIYKIISQAPSAEQAITQLSKTFKVDYVVDLEGRRYVAVFLGKVRLIDNVAI